MPRITQTLGFIGAGRMATALGRGCVESGLIAGGQVLATDPNAEAREKFSAQVAGARLVEDQKILMREAEIVVLAVKPQVMASVLLELAPHAEARHLFVSIAAGIPLRTLGELLPVGKLVRVMPNTPCLVGFGASCFSLGRNATPTESQLVVQILDGVGSATQVAEELLDAVTGLSGSGPAFVYSVIEALAEGGAKSGLPPALALSLAIQTARGAAEMLVQTGSSPAELREQVTSPGGTTVAGLEAFAAHQGADALRAAVIAASRRSAELGQSQ